MRAQQILVSSIAIVLGSWVGVHAAEWKPVSGHIMTEWAEKVDPNNPCPEYPRPQFVRANWVNLNGLWDYAVTPREQTTEAGRPNKWDGKILVPFCIESALSGVKRQLLSTERLWYSRSFTVPVLAPGERLLLNFDAVDYETEVRVNEKLVGRHKGGYDAFSCDITAVIKPGSNALVVSVLDATGGAQVRGKQSATAMKRPGGIRYTSTSGIWQTVWLEKVPEHYISSLKIVPDIDSGTVSVTVYAPEGDVKVSVLDGAQTLARAEGKSLAPIVLKIPQAKLWSPESPFLYDLDIRLGNDTVKSYFGMRKISVGKDEKGILRPMLNNAYVHFHGPLDQGYWPDGIYTAPTDEALKYDIEMTKKFGFNMTRKHIKVEPARWYYWTDKLGLLVWQDMPSGGAGKGANRQKDGTSISAEDATQFELELQQMLEQHINAPSIVWWIVFNEGWGQYDTPRLTKRVKELDPSRMVCNASGWHDAPSGDVIDGHRYPGPPRPEPTATRIAVNGEFGGIGLAVTDHLWVPDQTASSMYKTATDSTDYATRFLELWRQVYADDTSLGVSGAVYTQITDIEKEVNGLMTYDRKVVKMDIPRMANAVGKRIFPADLTGTQTMPLPSKKAPEKEKPSKIEEKLAKNLELLNQWGKQPEVAQTVYKAAFKVLSAKITASYADLARDAEFQKVCAKNNVIHLGGPMLGSVTADGARVWIRTVKPAKVEVRVMVEGNEKSFGPVESTLESDLSAVVTVSGLKSETRAPYRVLVDGKPIPVSEGAAIVTAPDSTKPGKVRITFGSCFHQWGLGNGKQADLIRSRNPTAFLIYGDIAAQDREHHVGYHRADYLMRDFFPAWQRIAATLPVYAIWDDHDYFNNDKSGIPPGYVKADIDSVWAVWRRAWNNPMYGFGDEGKGIFLRTRIGACDVIMTDGRYFRKGPDGKTLLGEEQMKWLEAQLLDCKGPFIILSSGTMWSDYVSDGKDSWGVYDPAGRERIFSFIEKNKIPGVLLISGDRHGARGFRNPRPSGYAFYEFEPASLGGRHGPPAARKDWHTQLFGIDKTYAFGEFSIDALLPDPEVTFRLISEDNKEIYMLTLKRSQLTPGMKQ